MIIRVQHNSDYCERLSYIEDDLFLEIKEWWHKFKGIKNGVIYKDILKGFKMLKGDFLLGIKLISFNDSDISGG